MEFSELEAFRGDRELGGAGGSSGQGVGRPGLGGQEPGRTEPALPPTAHEPVGPGAWTRAGKGGEPGGKGEESRWKGVSGGGSGSSWSGAGRITALGNPTLSFPSAPLGLGEAGALELPGPTRSQGTSSHSAVHFVPNRDTPFQSVYPAAPLSGKLRPTSMIFLICKETNPDLSSSLLQADSGLLLR